MYESFYAIVFLIYGSGPTAEADESNFKGVRFVILSIGYVALSLCYLNFLIAFISGTFERIQDKKDLHDVKELLDIIVDLNSFLEIKNWDRCVRLMCKWCRKPAPEGDFFLTLHPLEAEDQVAASLADLHSKVDCRLGDLDAKVDSQGGQLADLGSKVDGHGEKLANLDVKLDLILDLLKPPQKMT